MPLPLVWGLGVGIATAVAGGIRTVTGVKRIKAAERRYMARRVTFEQAETKYKDRQREADDQLQAFGKERLETTVVLGRAAEFLRKARVKDRQFSDRVVVSEEKLLDWEGASVKAQEVLCGVGGSVVSGAVTAAAVYGLVGQFAATSTGTAIATLSGVCAQNATLAWLGGGTIAAGGGGMAMGTVVLGGIVTGPAILVSSFFVHAKAAKVETAVEKDCCEMDRAEASMQGHIAYLDVVQKRVFELWRASRELKRALEELLVRANPESEEDVFQVAKVATSLGAVLDAAVLDQDGKPVTDEVKNDG